MKAKTFHAADTALERDFEKLHADKEKTFYWAAPVIAMNSDFSNDFPQSAIDPERLDLVLGRASQVFGDPEKAKEWLTTVNIALGDKPISLLFSEEGKNEVLAVLNSIAYGSSI